VWAITVPGGDELTNTQQYLAVFVGVHTDGKAVFEVVGGGATSPPPPPFTPTNWSTSVAGYLTTAEQTGAGRKITQTGTDDSPAGWWAEGVYAEFAGEGTSLGFIPYLAGDDVDAPDFLVSVHPDGTDAGLMANVDDTYPHVMLTAPGAYCSLSLVYATTAYVTGDHLYHPHVVAGAAQNEWLTAGQNATSFGVLRAVGGGPTITMFGGIDKDISACVIAEVKGGIVVGTTTPGTASPADSDYFIFCASGVAKKVTLADLAARVAEINASVPPPPP
jgi:hypothetical protein